MTLLLNLLPFAIAIIGFWLGLRLRKLWIILATVAALWVYMKAQPSYMPKGQVHRAPVPELEASDAQIEDRARRPDTLDQRNQRMKQAVQEGLPFN